ILHAPDAPHARHVPRARPLPARTGSPFQGPVALQQCRDAGLVGRAVEFGQEVVGAEFVEVAPPAVALVVPDAVAAGDAPGDVASSAHRRDPMCSDAPPHGRMTHRDLLVVLADERVDAGSDETSIRWARAGYGHERA